MATKQPAKGAMTQLQETALPTSQRKSMPADSMHAPVPHTNFI